MTVEKKARCGGANLWPQNWEAKAQESTKWGQPTLEKIPGRPHLYYVARCCSNIGKASQNSVFLWNDTKATELTFSSQYNFEAAWVSCSIGLWLK